MKALKILICLALATACTQAPSQKTLKVLQDAVDNGACLYAMQDALCYGQSWHPTGSEQTFERCDIKDVTGDFPAIAGFDLGGIELDNEANLDGVDFDYMKSAAVQHAQRGGLITFSWHGRNPLTGGDAWDVSSNEVVRSILPGGACHEMYMSWMDKIASFLESLTVNGELIPIIFRPYHENTGSWFWWGAGLCSIEDYIALWDMTYDYLAVERGLDMVWAYSPSSTALFEEGLQRYPGDRIVKIIGVDRYAMKGQAEVSADYIAGMQSDMEYLGAFAREHGLLLAVTETGQEGQTCPTWWTEELLAGIAGHPVCYVLTWRNAWDPEHIGHYFSPYKGAATEADFMAFYNSDKTAFLNNIK